MNDLSSGNKPCLASASPVRQRVEALRERMRAEGWDAFVVFSSDPHMSEYVPDHWKVREWISGFTGSAGTAVVTLSEAALWTDSRYFLQAERELADTGYCLMKERLPETPEIPDWLGNVLPRGARVAVCSTNIPALQAVEWECGLEERYGIRVCWLADEPWETLWPERPSRPYTLINIYPYIYAGMSRVEKVDRIRRSVASDGVDTLVLTMLDEIAWTLNIRANDVHCNPVALAWLVVDREGVTLYTDAAKLADGVKAELQADGVALAGYDDFYEALDALPTDAVVQVDVAHTNYEVYARLTRPVGRRVVERESPVALMKAVKHPAEMEGFRRAMHRDGVAMVRFLRWLEENVPGGEVTELGVDRALWRFRSEQENFCDISFDTIAGYGPHGAIVHYEATPETDIALKPEGLLLLDSGAQYLDGTTDITRTIALGPLSREACEDYTLVLKGHIALSRAEFPHGTCGTQLDVLARQYMWKRGINYLHGTGHGVGSYLNVHEGPHQIRMNHMPTPLVPGMTVTNEPGIYRTGSHGVRIENMMLVVPAGETDFGRFYRFETLTLCPIDMRPVLREMMTTDEMLWLREYHRRVYDELSPLLAPEETAWLEAKCIHEFEEKNRER